MTYSLTARLSRLLSDEGGWIGAALAGAGLLGKLFSSGAKASADGRAAESNIRLQQDQLRNQQYNTAQNAQMQAGNLDLNRKDFTEQARGGRAQQAALADLLGNFSPAQINVPGIQTAKVSGGLQGGLGEGGKAAMGELLKQALMAQLQGDTFTGGQVLQQPGLSALPKASGWEKLQGVLGTIGSLAGGVGAAFPQLGGGGSATASSAPNVQENLRGIINRNVQF